MSGLAARLAELRARIDARARKAGRDPAAVKLLAVTKTHPPERVLEAVSAGLRAFGENRVQEADAKIPAVAAAAGVPLEWHLVGSLQRNKAARAAALFDVVHSVDRAPLAAALERGAAAAGRHIQVLLQVNVDAEPQKGGAAPAELAELARAVDACAHLRLVGLMTVPRACADPEEVRPSFARMRSLLGELNRGRAVPLAELSMGMSDDFEVAVEEGATWLRIGTALFGARNGGAREKA
ncbi:MAG TPA: YggS family pyridoxal phosphate-dependent enzyme [Myxococcota bacterium]|nr:YggS family pyridoxal phosphate-dependent enzyme [Myxococcota bacterium]